MRSGWVCGATGGSRWCGRCVLFVFFDVKSRLEERWLTEKFAGYPEYRTRVKKLIPWVY